MSSEHLIAVVMAFVLYSKSAVVYFTKEVDPCLATLPLNFNGALAKLGLTIIVK